mgnify:CR=1 FL=1
MRTRVIDHPLVAHKLTLLRERSTPSPVFRQLVDELVTLLAYEATRDVAVRDVAIDTPVASATGVKLATPRPIVVPILRAGLGMLEGMVKLLPTAEVGFLGMKRDEETLEAVTYANRLPDDLSGRQCYILDPMLATGHTLIDSINYLLERGARDVTCVCLLAAPEGQVPARRLDWDGGVSGIRRRVSEDTICCRVLPLGKSEGTGGRRVTIADANGGVEWLQNDKTAAVTRMPDGSGGWEYPTKVITNEDAADAATLLAWARSVLARETTPKVTYEATLAGLADAGMDVSGLRLGDAVQCVDNGFFEGRPLRVEARVTRLSVDELKGGATVTIGSVWGLGMTVATLERRIEDAERTARDAKNQGGGQGQGHDDVIHTLDGERITKGTIAFTTEKKKP